jgi:5-methyltetrahydrofolate--homocysteine methyltransferase
MRALVKRLSLSVEAPLCIDSTEANVIDEALQVCPGSAIVNSINLENGRERIDAVMPLVARYGAAVIALTIDEQGMAKTAERKPEVARRIHGIVTREFGLPPGRLIFDDLTFTLATGDEEFTRSGIEKLEGIKLIKRELPGVLTSLGVSNVSFGLGKEARAVLNSVFLYHGVQAGLDMAIVNPADIIPYAVLSAEDRRLAEDLIFAREPQALAGYINHFEGRAPDARAREDEAAEASMTLEQRIHFQILHRKPAGIETLVDQAVKRQDPVAVLNTVLLPAMKEVGDKFGAGELILPFVLQSAEVMKKAVAQLERYSGEVRGRVGGTAWCWRPCSATCTTSAEPGQRRSLNNGYTVHDLGKQVPIRPSSTRRASWTPPRSGCRRCSCHQPSDADLRRRAAPAGAQVPVLIGGAAINRNFGRRAARGRRGVLRTRRVLLQGRVRGPGHHERAGGPRDA